MDRRFKSRCLYCCFKTHRLSRRTVSNANIIIKENTTVVIEPIGDVVVGQEVTINYTTNSNGTVTIKVNNQTITDGKFTPQTAGTYNLSVEIAENEYYTGAIYETTFKAVEEIATKISAIPTITSYRVLDYLVRETCTKLLFLLNSINLI